MGLRLYENKANLPCRGMVGTAYPTTATISIGWLLSAVLSGAMLTRA